MDISYPQATTITGGVARGRSLGGTLTLLTSSIGTDTSWPADGGILLIEDVDEEEYRLDRMLTQLRRSGYLDGVAGIVAGTFVGCGRPEPVQEILTERLGDLGVPMIAWANVGHDGYFQTFPVGVAAELDADPKALRLLDPRCGRRTSWPACKPAPQRRFIRRTAGRREDPHLGRRAGRLRARDRAVAALPEDVHLRRERRGRRLPGRRRRHGPDQ
jgi:hypothetical protein